MPSIFSDSAGVAALVDVPSVPVHINVDGFDARLSSCALTGLGISGQGGAQFLHTLADAIYVYVFGERAGDAAVQGIAFASACNGQGAGLDNVFDFYNQKRITQIGTPVTISFGAVSTIQGFLVGFRANLADAQFGLAQFDLHFKYMPQKARGPANP